MSTFLRVVCSTVFASAVLVTSASPTGCSDDGSGTTGRRIVLETRIAASPESKQFTNAKGWNVTITKALVSTGAMYFYDGDPLFAFGPRSRSSGFIRSASAHPGHYVPGNAKGEMLTPSSADLLAGTTLGVGDGTTGTVRSATFTYSSPATGPAAGELGANVIVLEGSAVKATETRMFHAELAPGDVVDTKGKTAIEGCPFAQADMPKDGTVTVTVDLTMWFDQVQFEELPMSVDGRSVTFTDGLARNQLVRGTKGALSYRFAYASR
ncbi:MAG TPA: hypothetical protein VM925_15615 [Labilithrix sp.]|nr:hypothetical protein [Labilithrix sp.]